MTYASLRCRARRFRRENGAAVRQLGPGAMVAGRARFGLCRNEHIVRMRGLGLRSTFGTHIIVAAAAKQFAEKGRQALVTVLTARPMTTHQSARLKAGRCKSQNPRSSFCEL